MTLRAAAVVGISFAAALLTGCYYPQPPAYAYYPPGCTPEAPPAAPGAEPQTGATPSETPSDAAPGTPPNAAPPPTAGTPCRLVPVYAYPSYPYYYPYYPGYYGYPAYPYGYPAVSVGIGGRFRL